ncbi:PorT family protein [Mucilaginibacter jinjuensis]|uniref:PorT family protein n=1 Tax=Mucilaginibacter jinjuensis TaxID=1176721 RepID=A0ABY7T834_9SPHI|nr:PorT family protein [Mucilaginibacter jinjuensis]WCT12403.1 PorT family protein [Mucilaginibacter jinjuensis]
MKKALFSIALLVTLTFGAKAQFILGVKGGADFSRIKADNLSASTLTGYQAGIFMRGGNSVFFQPEIYLNSSGSKFTAQNGGASAGGESVRFTNISFPLLFGGAFGPRNMNFRILGGPVYSAIIDKNRQFSDGFIATHPGIYNYVSNTLGYQGGIGGDIGAFTIDLRYEGGLTQINKDYSQRQNMWSLSLGFKVL